LYIIRCNNVAANTAKTAMGKDQPTKDNNGYAGMKMQVDIFAKLHHVAAVPLCAVASGQTFLGKGSMLMSCRVSRWWLM